MVFFKRWISSLDEKSCQELNQITFFIFIIPAIISKVFAGYMGFIHDLFFGWIHELGHFMACIWGELLFCILSGTGLAILASLIPGLILIQRKILLPAALSFLMGLGLTIQHTGWYISTSIEPTGRSIMLREMTPENHDWANVFEILGIPLTYSPDIGFFISSMGHALAIIFLTASVCGLIMNYFKKYVGLTILLSLSGMISFQYFILIKTPIIEVLISLLFLITYPVLKRWRKNGKSLKKRLNGKKPVSYEYK